MLNLSGFKNRYGKPFGRTALQSVLKSEKYVGIRKWGDVELESGYPAIVDQETFEKVQIRLNQNRRSAAKNKAKMEYLLYGKIYCGSCW